VSERGKKKRSSFLCRAKEINFIPERKEGIVAPLRQVGTGRRSSRPSRPYNGEGNIPTFAEGTAEGTCDEEDDSYRHFDKEKKRGEDVVPVNRRPCN